MSKGKIEQRLEELGIELPEAPGSRGELCIGEEKRLACDYIRSIALGWGQVA